MKRAILDTSFLFALTNRKDRQHRRVLEVATTLTDTLILPISVLPEICYLLASRLGYLTMQRFLSQLTTSEVLLESLTTVDLERVVEILEEYADSHLDFVDATIIAIAERQQITRILTLDRRDFTIIRPRHCTYFEILP